MSTRGSPSRTSGRARSSSPSRSGASAPAPARATPAASDERIQHIPVADLHVGLNPREHFDQESIRELADSIREHGLLQPISVRPHEGGYQIIAGERRYRALQLLGEKSVPVIVHQVSDQKAHELALIENVVRRDMRPGETARAYQALMERSGLSLKDIAARTGKSQASIQQHLDLLAIPAHLQKAVDEGRLSMSLVRDLSRLSAKGQEEAAGRIFAQDLGVRSAKQVIRAIYSREQQLDLFTGVHANTKAEMDAKARYEDAIRRITEALHGLDDETMQHYTHALEVPGREAQRLALMGQQLRRMQRLVEQEQRAREVGVRMAASTAPHKRSTAARAQSASATPRRASRAKKSA